MGPSTTPGSHPWSAVSTPKPTSASRCARTRQFSDSVRLRSPTSTVGCSLGVPHAAWYHHCVKTIQVRNVPDDVHRVLRSRAAAAGVSLSDYALGELERVARHPPVADLLARARARAGGASAEAIVAAVRDGRDRD